ncbi:MAG: hypothetical protein J0I63_16890 [Thiobacillus sp.]|nr:hypothetical protein [Thiobacillus sp.]
MSAVSDPCARIFLLSHMRACTSLAGHILGSHPQINGYYEMHLGYEEPAALDRQLEVFRQGDALKPGSRYLFDKLLHNDYPLRPERLGLADIKILVVLAEPAHTIRSIVHLFRQKPEPEYCYFDAELWQRAPERLLPRLTAWLELDAPLSERYAVFSRTGTARRGDTSARMGSGRIDRTRSDYSQIEVPQEALEAAQAAYRECRERIVAGAADSVIL